MTTVGAGPRTSRNPDAGMMPNNLPLPARGRGGANHRYLGSNPVATRIECPNMPDVTLPLQCFQLSGLCQVDVGAIAGVRSSGGSPSPLPQFGGSCAVSFPESPDTKA